ncbi:MAG: transposase [Acidovorax sp.]
MPSVIPNGHRLRICYQARPGQAGQPGTTAKNNRLFVDAVLYRYRAGIAWRDLPERFGDFRVVHTRHSRWSKSGVWQRVFGTKRVISSRTFSHA